MLRNEQDAHDVAHETMIKVMTNLSKYDPSWSFSTWVCRIAKNTAIDLIRKRKRISWSEIPNVSDPNPFPDEIAIKQQQARIVRQVLDELPAIYRDVLRLHHFENLKYREIADTLDVPLGTVMNRIHRARRKLRARYEKEAA